jgi:hypothetical protein
MLVDADYGSIDHYIFEVAVIGQSSENPLEDALQRPSPKPPPHRIPLTMPFGKVAPGRPCPRDPKHAFQKEPVIPPCNSWIAMLAGEQPLNPPPLCVAKNCSIHR